MLVNKAATRDAVHQLFDAVDAISVQGYDEERRVTYWNTGSELLYGYTKEEALGRKLEELIIPENMRDFVISAHSNWLNQGIEIPPSELTLRQKNGKDVSVFSNHVLFIDENNKKEMYCIDINLAEVRQAQAQAVFKENMLEAVLEATPDLFFLMEEDGTIIDYHASDKKNLYVSPKEFIGNSIVDLLPENVASKFKVYISKAIDQGGVLSFEYELNMPHGMTYFEARLSHLKSYKQVVIVVRDITEQHNSAEIIRQHAYFDTLTLLPNRFLSLDRLSQILEEAKRSSEKTAVLF
jgi:PAS domain S-box-containing protein